MKRATKSWRHPLRKPTARAVPTAVKQQAASDDGRSHILACAELTQSIVIILDFYPLSYFLT